MLDTDTVSYLIKKHPPGLQQKFNAMVPDRLCISVMTRAELQYGLQRLPSEHRLHLIARQFLKIIRILPWESDAADWYATIRHQLISSGQPIGEFDTRIAAHALSVGAVLVSNNTRHFQRIAAPLLLTNWLE